MSRRQGARPGAPSENARMRAKAVNWLKGIDGGAAILALGRLLQGLEDEATAGSNKERAAARQYSVNATAELLAPIGAAGVLKRRMLTDGRQVERGTVVDVREFESFMARSKNPTRAVRLATRIMTGRLVEDLWGLIEPKLAHWVMQTMWQAAQGRKGLLSPESTERVDPADGDAHTQRLGAIADAGRAARARYGEKGKIPKSFWGEAAESYNRRAELLRQAGERCDSVDSGERFRQWCQRKTGRTGKEREAYKIFIDARKEGAEAEAAKIPDTPNRPKT